MSQSRSNLLDTAVDPGSIAKVATLIAALGEGVITSATALPCRRRVVVDGHVLTCVHPDLGRPLTAEEALAHSCNDFFAAVAGRVSSGALNAALVRLGLSPIPAGRSRVLGALGLAGARAAPIAMLRGFVRLFAAGADESTGRPPPAAVLAGLRGAATYGTAASLGARGIDALAKTGTVPMPGGGYMGIAVALAPSTAPARGVVVVAPGGSGRDAAEIAARLLEAVGAHGGAGSEARSSSGPAVQPAPPDGPQTATIVVGRLGLSGTYVAEPMPLEDYVGAVVAAEAPPGAPQAALEALAIVARSYALASLGRHRADGFDLCDLTHCQVVGRPTEASRRAASQTAGLALHDGSRVARVLYTASCGGQLELPSSVWGGMADDRWCTRRSEPECRAATAWSARISAADLGRALAAAGIRGGPLTGLSVAARTPAGLASRVRLDGFVPPEVSGEEFRLLIGRTLGWAHVRSARFEITRTPHGFRFDGSGRGHLVGMCLEGAARAGAAGATRAAILATYFPGLRVAPGAERPAHDRISVTLPLAERDRAGEVRAMVGVELLSLERDTGERAPRRVAVVFHPTVASYERATGMPWWTTAATTGARIDCLPIDLLRQRGLLGGTVRHELVHVLTEPVLAGRPRWVREGAAMFFAGDDDRWNAGTVGEPAPGDCPSDDSFTRASSKAEAGKSYRLARACFAAGLQRAGRWQDIGK